MISGRQKMNKLNLINKILNKNKNNSKSNTAKSVSKKDLKIKMNFLFKTTFITILLCACSFFYFSNVNASAPLTIEALKEHYQHVKSISADVKQTKTAPYLFKPIISQILLSYEKNKITWETTAPTKQTIVIQNNELYSISDEGVQENIPIAKSPQGAKLLSFFNSLFSMDFNALQNSFQLVFSGQQMEALPKKDSGLQFINKMTFDFDKNLNIHTVTVEAGQENTKMLFSNVVIGSR